MKKGKKPPLPRKVLNFVGRKVDISTGRLFYGNTAGLKNNFQGVRDRSKNKTGRPGSQDPRHRSRA